MNPLKLSRPKLHRLLVAICAVAPISFATAQQPSLDELERRCEEAREKKIAPLREQAIEECIASNPRRRDAESFCRRFYGDFGQGGATASGGTRPRMFHDLPECLEYEQARRQGRTR